MKIFLTCLILLFTGLANNFAQVSQVKNPYFSIMPAIFPAPASIQTGEGSINLGKTVVLIVAPGTDPVTEEIIRNSMISSGVGKIETAQKLPSVLDRSFVVVGIADSKIVQSALTKSRAVPGTQREGYTLVTASKDNGSLITLAGNDSDGLFYAAQTFHQLFQHQSIPALVIKDYPAMPIRGTIEGFYGKPWTMQERTKHLEFLGSIKANTYVYSPKDDPYARDKWREAYPAEILEDLNSLVATAQKNHVNFVYAISPGPSICFSNPEDLYTLKKKFEVLRSIGIHNFYVALDDIEYAKWNCEQDREIYGPSGTEAAGIAQAELLNKLQEKLDSLDPEAQPLIMVPTEYYNTTESPYKAALRKNLNPKIVVQWTGTDVVPPAISVVDARAATAAFGRKTLLWDNYPVNDYAQTAGRLLLAPYKRREAGLSEELSGILSNPMNQEAPSRVAVTGVAAFAWNDRDYDADLTWRAAARNLAGGDEQLKKALLMFFDTQHLAPTFGSQPWQEQAPKMKMILDGVREAIAYGDENKRQLAISGLLEYAEEFEKAPEIIKSGSIDYTFVEQSRPWLDAMQLWGRALQQTAAGLDAANEGNREAHRHFDSAKKFAEKAVEIQSIPGATRVEGSIKIADGVLDKFVADAPGFFIFASGGEN